VGTVGGLVTVSDASNVTSATKIADALGKGLVCINTSVTVTSIVAYIGDEHGNTDLSGEDAGLVFGAVQSQVPNANCAGSQAWVRTYGPDGHRRSEVVTIYVIFQ